jgi:hypothetical protein
MCRLIGLRNNRDITNTSVYHTREEKRYDLM